jgi:hypothetical protein
VPKVHTKPIKGPRKGFKQREQGITEGTLVWRTGLSGVPPDNVRCNRVLQLKLFTFGFPRRSSAIIHRTVRCATGLSGAPAEQRISARNSRLCKVNSTAAEVRAAVRGAPDCPVPLEDRASNDRPAPRPNGRMTWQRTGLSGAPFASRLHQRLDFGWWL